MKGYFITFEGVEGSGKSTQIKSAARFLKQNGCKVLLLREPGGTQVSEAIREVILNPKFKGMTAETELLLYLAARAQIVRECIIPALKKGYVVICDRYEDSTLAYQGYGRGFSTSLILKMSALVRGNIRPSLTFLLDIDPRAGMKRGGRYDRLERESFVFHAKVRKGFLALARKNPGRFSVISGTLSKSEIAKKIQERLKRVLR